MGIEGWGWGWRVEGELGLRKGGREERGLGWSNNEEKNIVKKAVPLSIESFSFNMHESSLSML